MFSNIRKIDFDGVDIILEPMETKLCNVKQLSRDRSRQNVSLFFKHGGEGLMFVISVGD